MGIIQERKNLTRGNLYHYYTGSDGAVMLDVLDVMTVAHFYNTNNTAEMLQLDGRNATVLKLMLAGF